MKIVKKKKKRIFESDNEDESNVHSFIDDEAACSDKISSDEESDGSIADFIDDSEQNDTKPYYNNELTEVSFNAGIFLFTLGSKILFRSINTVFLETETRIPA